MEKLCYNESRQSTEAIENGYEKLRPAFRKSPPKEGEET
jgi:hypothetical protein